MTLAEMELQLVDYLAERVRLGLPAIASSVVRQSLKPDSPPKFVLISVYAGVPDRYTTKQTFFSVQTLIQSDTDESARLLAHEVYDFLKEDYDFELAVPVGKTGDPVFVTQMKPESIPSPLGNVGNGKYRYSANYSILLGEI